MVTAQAPWEQRLGQGQVVCWGGRLEKEKEPRKDVVSSKSSLSPLGSLGHRVVPSGDKEEAAFSTPTVTVGPASLPCSLVSRLAMCLGAMCQHLSGWWTHS